MKPYFLLLLLAMLAGCEQNQPCNTVNLATKDYLNVKIVSSSGVGGFVNNGYTSFYVNEVNQSYPTDYNAYYEETSSTIFTSLKLPIAHNYPQTTFIFKGPGVADDTIVVSNYNARAELTNNCGYRLTIDEPTISKFTFSVRSKANFDDNNNILTFQILM